MGRQGVKRFTGVTGRLGRRLTQGNLKLGFGSVSRGFAASELGRDPQTAVQQVAQIVAQFTAQPA